MLEIILQTAKNSNSITLTNKEKTQLINAIPYELTAEEIYDFCEAIESLRDDVNNLQKTNTLKESEVIDKVSFFVNKGIPYEIIVDFMKSKEATKVFLEKDLESSFKKLKKYADVTVESLNDGDDIADIKYESVSKLHKNIRIA